MTQLAIDTSPQSAAMTAHQKDGMTVAIRQLQELVFAAECSRASMSDVIDEYLGEVPGEPDAIVQLGRLCESLASTDATIDRLESAIRSMRSELEG